MARDDFTKPTIRDLAARVNLHCSNPGCSRPTSGPDSRSQGAISIGVAAHITAAAPGGKRYDPNITAEERRSHDNGIWLCQSCSRLIDTDEERYTVERLQGWKQTAEHHASEQLERPNHWTYGVRSEGNKSTVEVPPSSAQTPDADYHAEIDVARDLIKGGKPSIAKFKLLELKDKNWPELSEKERYRLVANLGHADCQLGDFKAAGSHFVAAAIHQPESAEALAMKAIGLDYLGRKAEAYETAQDAIAQNADGRVCATALIATAPDSVPHEELISRIGADALADQQVCLALARRLRAEGNLQTALEYARKAEACDTSWPESLEELGSLLLEMESRDLRTRLAMEPRAFDPERVKEAQHLFKKALNSPGLKSNQKKEALVRIQLSSTYRLLGQDLESRSELALAVELDGSNPEIAVRHARSLHEEGRYEEARTNLLRMYRGAPDLRIALALGFISLEETDEERLLTVTEILKSALRIPGEPVQSYEDLGELLLTSLHKLGRPAEIAAALDTKLPLRPLYRRILIARGAWLQGETESAKELAKEVSSEIKADSDKDLQLPLARLLVELGLREHAFRHFKRTVEPDYVGPDTRELLRCARESGEDAFILEFCKALRANGLLDTVCLEWEAELLAQYNSPDEGIKLMQELINTHQDETVIEQARLQLSVIGIQFERYELIEQDAERLPSVHEVTPSQGHLVVNVLRLGASPEKALEYAYELYRLHPGDFSSYCAVIAALTPTQTNTPEVTAPDTVEVGTAFAYKEEGRDPKWYVIEESDPKAFLSEIGLGHPLARAVIGKKAGTAIEWHQSGTARAGKVVELLNKYAYRFRECLRNIEDIFPNETFVRSMPLRASGSSTLQSVEQHMQERYRRAEELVEAYSRGHIPLVAISRAFNRTKLDAHLFIARQPNVTVLCPERPTQDKSILTDLGNAKEVLLDVSAIGTLLLLDEGIDLSSLPFRPVVTQGTLLMLRGQVASHLPSSDKTFGVKDNELIIIGHDKEAAKEHTERVRALLNALENPKSVVSGEALAAAPREERHRLLTLLGRESAETIAAAAARGIVIWTDELLVGELSKQGHGVDAVSTSMILKSLSERGFIAQEKYLVSTAYLCAMRFGGVPITGSTILTAAELGSWDPDSPVLDAALKVLATGVAAPEQLALIACQLFVEIWRTSALEEQIEAVLSRAMKYLDMTVPGRATLETIRRRTDLIFGLDVVSAEKTRSLIATWQSLRA